VAFPLTLQPLAVNRPLSVEAVNSALAGDRLVLLLLQRGDDDEPAVDRMYEYGTIGIIRQMARAPQGLNIIVEGMARARAETLAIDGGMLRAKILLSPEQVARNVEADAYVRRIQELVERALTLTSGLAPEVRQLVAGIDDPLRLCYLLGTMLDLKAEERQQLLEADPLVKKLELVHSLLTREVSVLEIKGKIESQAQQEMTDAQRQYYLRQQMKAIQEELGEGDGTETKDLRERVEQANLPAPVKTVADRELDRLARMGPASPESQMIRTYLEWILVVLSKFHV
jgi:ATP-dependent Lon protease